MQWKEPPQNVQRIQKYEVYYKVAAADLHVDTQISETRMETNDNSPLLTGLQLKPGTYIFQIVAKGELGYSEPSDESDPIKIVCMHG